MVVKIYISGISGNKEVKKRQQRVLMILDSKSIKYELIDITEPGRESDKEYMQNNSKSNGGTVSDPNPRSPLPPQMFNDDEYCGDYEQFDLANEVDTLEQFLKVEVPPEEPLQAESEKEKAVNGDVDKESKESKEETQETPVEEKTTNNGETVLKESTPTKEESPSKEGTPAREALPADGESKDAESDALAQGDSKEATPERQKSVNKEATPEKAASPEKELESKEVSKEYTPEKEEPVNENGTVSSREPSQEKVEIDETNVERKKEPSELLIQSEQTAAAE